MLTCGVVDLEIYCFYGCDLETWQKVGLYYAALVGVTRVVKFKSCEDV